LVDGSLVTKIKDTKLFLDIVEASHE